MNNRWGDQDGWRPAEGTGGAWEAREGLEALKALGNETSTPDAAASWPGNGAGYDTSWPAQSGSTWNRPADGQAGQYEGTHDSAQNGYGSTQDGYGSTQNGYGSTQNGYGSTQNGYGSTQNGYGSTQNGYGSDQNGYYPAQNVPAPATDYAPYDTSASYAPDRGTRWQRYPSADIANPGVLDGGRNLVPREYPRHELATRRLRAPRSSLDVAARGLRTTNGANGNSTALAPRSMAARPLAQTQPDSPDRRRRWTVRQRIGGLLVAAACIAAALWYIPKVIYSDEHSLVGTVSSTGVVDLNFATSGQISTINVAVGQQVKKGQVLATEYAPASNAIVTADKAAINADNAKIAQIKQDPTANQAALLAAANAQLDKDEETLANDQANLGRTRIVASANGTVVAVNGQAGEDVTAQGIRDFSSVSGGTPVRQQPGFSLLPEAPQSNIRSSGSSAELPVVALRTANTWNVVVLIPENQISRVKAGARVTISVPSASISNVPGQIIEVLPSPQSTNQGVAYQAVISVLGHENRTPLSGMSADVQLGA